MNKEEIEILLIKYGVAFSNRVNVREFRGTKQFEIAEDELKKAEKAILDLLSHPESERKDYKRGYDDGVEYQARLDREIYGTSFERLSPESEERVEYKDLEKWSEEIHGIEKIMSGLPKKLLQSVVIDIQDKMLRIKGLVEVDREEKEKPLVKWNGIDKPIGKFTNIKRNKKSISFKIKLDKNNG